MIIEQLNRIVSLLAAVEEFSLTKPTDPDNDEHKALIIDCLYAVNVLTSLLVRPDCQDALHNVYQLSFIHHASYTHHMPEAMYDIILTRNIELAGALTDALEEEVYIVLFAEDHKVFTRQAVVTMLDVCAEGFYPNELSEALTFTHNAINTILAVRPSEAI